jgi:phosphoglycolate phosphatase-like HAD superfamily hydrolase
MRVSRLLLFDIDGTMISCRGRGLRAMHRTIQELFGLPPATAEVQAYGKTDPILFEEVGAAYGIAAAQIVARGTQLAAHYVEVLAADLAAGDACSPKPGVGALLAALERRPEVALGLVSGNLEPAAWLKLRAAGLHGFFAAGAFGSDSRHRHRLVELAIGRLAGRHGCRFAPWQVWVVGDTPADVESGRTNGTRTLAVATGGYSPGALAASGADYVLEDFTATDTVVDILCRPQ